MAYPLRTCRRLFSAGVFLLLAGLLTLLAQAQLATTDTLTTYKKAKATDPVARLQKQIAAGTVTLQFDKRHGYLPAVLKALGVPQSSQTLVFSKTSFQRDSIAPW